MNWLAVCAERIGGREEQQDSVGVFHSADGAACLLVVADGMGGHRGGSLASQTVLDVAEQNWASCDGAPEDPKQFLEELCQQAHIQVNLRGQEQGLEPHSTVVALLARGTEAFWVHVGDSRLYHFRDTEFLGRTRDHSMVQVLVEAGEVSEEEMATHPDQNKLLRSIGGEDPPKTTHESSALEPQDRFLLCSDGFWEQISTEEMAAGLRAKNLDASLASLVETAAQRGGAKGDNVAVAGIRALSGKLPKKKTRLRNVSKTGLLLALLIVAALLWVPSIKDGTWFEALDIPVSDDGDRGSVGEQPALEGHEAPGGTSPQATRPEQPAELDEHEPSSVPPDRPRSEADPTTDTTKPRPEDW